MMRRERENRILIISDRIFSSLSDTVYKSIRTAHVFLLSIII